MSNQTEEANECPLNSILGHQLSSVEFVQDYVQLHFDGSRLTAITTPIVEYRGSKFTWNSPGYRDALCERISKIVINTSLTEGREIMIKFDDSSAILVSLKQKDLRAAEAAHFQNDAGKFWTW